MDSIPGKNENLKINSTYLPNINNKIELFP